MRLSDAWSRHARARCVQEGETVSLHGFIDVEVRSPIQGRYSAAWIRRCQLASIAVPPSGSWLLHLLDCLLHQHVHAVETTWVDGLVRRHCFEPVERYRVCWECVQGYGEARRTLAHNSGLKLVLCTAAHAVE